MPIRHSLWCVGEAPQQLTEEALPSEALLEHMIVAAPEILSDQWMLVGRQEETGYGGRIDLLALAPDGTLVLIELKRDRTPREVVAQALDYAAWVETLDAAAVSRIYARFRPDGELARDFQTRFGSALEEATLNGSHQVVIVASALDAASERIVGYLNRRGLPINVLCFQVFGTGTEQLLSRAWLLDPTEVQATASAAEPATTREPWNGEFYVSFGHSDERSWPEAIRYGFICAGGGSWYSGTLNLLSVGDRVWVKAPGYGFVGVGKVTGPRQPALDFTLPGGRRPARPRDERIARGGLSPATHRRPCRLRILRACHLDRHSLSKSRDQRRRLVRQPEHRLPPSNAHVAAYGRASESALPKSRYRGLIAVSLRQHTPLVLTSADGMSHRLAPVSLQLGRTGGGHDEAWIRDLVFAHPAALPVSEIEPSFGPLIPVCTELDTRTAGFADALFLNPLGMPTLVECKLWRNPEARREVVGQILDYASVLRRWTFADLQREVARARRKQGFDLSAHVRDRGGLADFDEAAFVDNVTRNLSQGRLLLLVVGDGIRAGVETIADYIQGTTGLHFTFGLVEMQVFELGEGRRIVQPRVLAKTLIVNRTVVDFAQPGLTITQDGSADDATSSESTAAISEATAGEQWMLQFWTELLAGLRLDDTEQALPKPSKQGNIFFSLTPRSDSWLTCYFLTSKGEIGVFLGR